MVDLVGMQIADSAAGSIKNLKNPLSDASLHCLEDFSLYFQHAAF
jgi:hypothetical protein